MAKNSTSRKNLVHYLDDDEIEDELTFFNEDGHLSDNEVIANQMANNNQFKRRRLLKDLDTNNTKPIFDDISPISFAPNLSSLNKNNQQPYSIQKYYNSNKRKNDIYSSSSYHQNFNDPQEVGLKNGEYEIDSNEPFMPAHKSIKIDTNVDAVTSPVASSSTPIAISTPNPRRTALPVRSSTPILPPAILKSEGSFSSLSSISSINKSKTDSNLSSIREDLNSPSDLSSSSLSSSSNLNEPISSKDFIHPTSTSTPMLHVTQKLDSENGIKDFNDVKDIYSTEKLMNSKLIINLPSSVRNKNLYWSLGVNSSDSIFSPFSTKDKNALFSPYRSPILNNNNDVAYESSDYSPTPYQKPNKSEGTGSELVLFKPLPWKQSLQDSSTSAKDNNTVLSQDLMVNTNNSNNTGNQDSFGTINNSSNSPTPTSAIITSKLPLLSLNKSPDKSNSSFILSNSLPIPITQNNGNHSNVNMNTSTLSPISPVTPISLSMMNVDQSSWTPHRNNNTNNGNNSNNSNSNNNNNSNNNASSPSSRKELDIPFYPHEIQRYNNISSSFSVSPSPMTSSALMNGISRNSTELQSNSRNYKSQISDNADLFDYKNDFLLSNLEEPENEHKDTIPHLPTAISASTTPTPSNIHFHTQSEMSGTAQSSYFIADSMDVDF